MPVLLTTPFNPGDIDPGQTYLRAKIVHFDVSLMSNGGIRARYQFGNMVGDDWVKGAASPEREVMIQNEPAFPGPATTDFDDMMAEVALESEGYSLYAGVKRVIYQWLIDKGLLAGTIE